MFRIRKEKSKRGFILIYVLFICSICFIVVLGFYKMEVLIRDNNLKLQSNVIKVDKLQKTKEYLLTELDEKIHGNVSEIKKDNVRKYLDSTESFNVKYDENCIEYRKNDECFLIRYYINHKFYKEELYEYEIIDGSIFYGCMDYSFEQGGIK